MVINLQATRPNTLNTRAHIAALEDQSGDTAEALRLYRDLLPDQEREIARLIADDLTNRQIAARLFLSEHTVETHITNILNKLGLNSRIQISRWMTGLSEPGLTTAEERP